MNAISKLLWSVLLLFATSCNDATTRMVRDRRAGPNGSFEICRDGYPVNWVFPACSTNGPRIDVQLDAVRPSEGAQCLRFSCANLTNRIEFATCPIRIRGGAVYRIAFDLRNQGCELLVNRIFQHGTGREVRQSQVLLDTRDSFDTWRTFSETVRVQDPIDYLVLHFIITHPGTVWCDNLQVEECREDRPVQPRR